ENTALDVGKNPRFQYSSEAFVGEHRSGQFLSHDFAILAQYRAAETGHDFVANLPLAQRLMGNRVGRNQKSAALRDHPGHQTLPAADPAQHADNRLAATRSLWLAAKRGHLARPASSVQRPRPLLAEPSKSTLRSFPRGPVRQ